MSNTGATSGLITFGHSTAERERLTELLHTTQVNSVLDVRIGPGSRRNPDLNRGSLGRWTPNAASPTAGRRNWEVVALAMCFLWSATPYPRADCRAVLKLS